MEEVEKTEFDMEKIRKAIKTELQDIEKVNNEQEEESFQCPKCKTLVAAYQVYCNNCGRELEWA